MKKVLSVILVLAMVLCFAACGKDSKSGGSNIAGKYKFSYMEQDGEKLTAADLKALTGAEVDTYVRLDGDGTGVMYSEGTTEDMVYADGKIWPVSDPEDKADLSVKGNTLTISQDGMTMVFKK